MKHAARKDDAAMSEPDNNKAGAPALDIPEAVAAALNGWVQQVAEQAAAPVSKAKDQLAIDGKDRQLADLRAQLERNVAAQASESDARLAAEMELVGATTARDNFESEVKTLRAQLDKSYAERSALRTELESLRAKK